MSTLITAFSVPIATTQLDDCARLNAGLRDLFLQCEAQGSRFANPEPYTHRNQALFESAFNLFDWPQPEIRKLRELCLSELRGTVAGLNDLAPGTEQQLDITLESWFHVTRKGGYFGVHNHPMHSWSGVYCVCQEGDEDNVDSGLLTFISPYVTNTMFVDLTSHRMKPPFQMGDIPTRLRPGQLVLFPSWLLHQVTPFEPREAGLRITVAFNARFKLNRAHPSSPLAPTFLGS